MKPYFAKYLPVEEHFHYVGAIIRDKETGAIGIIKKVGEGINETQFEHVKLFLCSRDIQAGDKVWFNDPNPNVEGFKDWSGYGSIVGEEDNMIGVDLGHTSTWEPSTQFIKVIGEISPEAIWIKEGDEFEGEEVDYPWTSSLDNHTKLFCKIKGPCGRFH